MLKLYFTEVLTENIDKIVLAILIASFGNFIETNFFFFFSKASLRPCHDIAPRPNAPYTKTA
jgi:hypothetical protein